MSKADVVNIQGEKVGEVELNDAVWNTDVKPYLIHDVVVMQLNNRRRGTASTKTRKDISGGGKKPYRQGRGTRRRKKALEAERHRQGEIGKHHVARVGRRRNRVRPEAEGIPHVGAQEGEKSGPPVGPHRPQ